MANLPQSPTIHRLLNRRQMAIGVVVAAAITATRGLPQT